MRIGREAEPAELLRDDHAEEAMRLDEVPDLWWKIAQLPADLPVVEHGAQLVDRPFQERLLFSGQRRRRYRKKLCPVRVAGEKIRVPPDVAGLQCLALGVRHRGHRFPCPGKDRLADVIPAERAHVSRSFWSIKIARSSARHCTRPMLGAEVYNRIAGIKRILAPAAAVCLTLCGNVRSGPRCHSGAHDNSRAHSA